VLAAGWTGQRWTLAHIQDLIAATFKVAYTIPGIWYLLRCRGWTCQIGARRANERDDGAVEVWKTADKPPVPAQQRVRRHQPTHPQRPGKQPGQGSQHRTIGPAQLRPGVLPPQHRDLLAEHQQLGILRRFRARQ
jgi:Winged helix-turn helix